VVAGGVEHAGPGRRHELDGVVPVLVSGTHEAGVDQPPWPEEQTSDPAAFGRHTVGVRPVSAQRSPPHESACSGDKVGLEVLIESDDFVTFRCGGDSRLVVTRTSTPSTEQTTSASWRVDDVAVEVANLRARGVDVIDYDEPGLQTTEGVADVGFALSAWFVDPGGNTIGMLQFKDEALA
jgi:hypothetical protein